VLPPGLVLERWQAPDGWALRRFTWAPAEGVRPRGALLFLGGRGDFVEKYLEGYAHFRRGGWRVHGFDWRGQGESGRLSGDPTLGHADDFSVLVDDLAAVVRDVRAGTEGPLVAIGHSMGGHLLLRYLARAEPLVDAAVLVAPMLGFANAPPPAVARLVAMAACAIGRARKPAWRAGERPGDTRRQASLTSSRERYGDEMWWRAANPALALGPPSWGWLRAALASNAVLDRRGALERVRVPILLLEAGRDRLVSGAAIARAAARLPDARLVTLAESAHEVLRESDPVRDRALGLIDGFFDTRAVAA
jgi:lysophospholipase